MPIQNLQIDPTVTATADRDLLVSAVRAAGLNPRDIPVAQWPLQVEINRTQALHLSVTLENSNSALSLAHLGLPDVADVQRFDQIFGPPFRLGAAPPSDIMVLTQAEQRERVLGAVKHVKLAIVFVNRFTFLTVRVEGVVESTSTDGTPPDQRSVNIKISRSLDGRDVPVDVKMAIPADPSEVMQIISITRLTATSNVLTALVRRADDIRLDSFDATSYPEALQKVNALEIERSIEDDLCLPARPTSKVPPAGLVIDRQRRVLMDTLREHCALIRQVQDDLDAAEQARIHADEARIEPLAAAADYLRNSAAARMTTLEGLLNTGIERALELRVVHEGGDISVFTECRRKGDTQRASFQAAMTAKKPKLAASKSS
jgi:hypothetical protein